MSYVYYDDEEITKRVYEGESFLILVVLEKAKECCFLNKFGIFYFVSYSIEFGDILRKKESYA